VLATPGTEGESSRHPVGAGCQRSTSAASRRFSSAVCSSSICFSFSPSFFRPVRALSIGRSRRLRLLLTVERRRELSRRGCNRRRRDDCHLVIVADDYNDYAYNQRDAAYDQTTCRQQTRANDLQTLLANLQLPPICLRPDCGNSCAGDRSERDLKLNWSSSGRTELQNSRVHIVFCKLIGSSGLFSRSSYRSVRTGQEKEFLPLAHTLGGFWSTF
jgi:hypothetical protein